MDMEAYDTTLLYVLSGTGNTFRVARWIGNLFESNSIKTRLLFIEDADFQEDFKYPDRQLTAVMFPTHGFMPPWSMIKFLFRMPRQKKAPVLSVATRGAIWIGPVKIPGAAGFANFFTALVLLLKGYDVRGFFSLDMASNFNNFHPSLTATAVDAICQRSRRKLAFFMARVMAGKRVLFTLNNLYEGIWAILLSWAIPVLPILYLLFAKTSMAKIMYSNNKCVSCGMCARICPNDAIEMKSFFGKKHPFWTYHCENCMRCMGYCKKQAVEAGHSWMLLLAVIMALPVFANLTTGMTHAVGNFLGIHNYWLLALLDALYYIPALFLSYWIFWMLIRIPVINALFSVTTLTHYYKRFHDPETRVKFLMTKKEENTMRIELKYFSGTGNSYKVLDTCKAIFSENGHEVALSSITDKTPIETNADLIGFCFPVYAFGIPRICRNYLSHLPTFNHSINAFVLITAGAADEAGFSVKESVRYMKQKGLKVTYSDVIHMPSNWTVAMNPPAKDEAQEIIATGISKAEETARAILEGARYHHAFNYPARLSKFGFYKDYYLFKWLGVSNLWRDFRADETCDGCGLCEKICPTGSIRMPADRPEWLKTCEQCMRCVNYCPHKAIYQTGEGSIKGKNRYYEPTFRPLKIKAHKANSTDAKSHTVD